MSSGTCIREQGLPANRSGLTCWQIVSQTFVAFIQSGMLRHFADDSMCVTGGCAQTALTGSSGNGYTNNRVFASSSDNQTAVGAQNASTGNAAKMILLLLFLQKQSLAFAVYLFGIGTLHTGPYTKLVDMLI